MASRPILVDTTRLLTRLKHPSPSGIDRVDLAYARQFLTGAPDRQAVAIGYFGPRLLPDAKRAELISTLAERWREDMPADRDPVLAGIRDRLAGSAPPTAPVRQETAVPKLRLEVADQLNKAGGFRWMPAARAPLDAIYLHTSHLRLDKPEQFAWLAARPDIRAVFFVHDLIPIDFPEYAVPGEAARHRVRMATVARHAAAILANSADVGARFSSHCEAAGLRCPPVAVAPLGAEDAFLRGPARVPGARPYFVVCSTIEARKNHLLLLQVWRNLVGRHGPDTPALVIVGRRGWESEAAVDLLDRCEALKGHVFEASGLSTAGLAELLSGAQALLMPSFAEGYGIPVVEALSVGTPAIVSDIPVHREVGGALATFVDPLDGPGWIAAIERHAVRPAEPIAGYLPPTWEAHFRTVNHVLAEL